MTSSWDTPSLVNARAVAYGCADLERLDISGLDTSNDLGTHTVLEKLPNLKSLRIGTKVRDNASGKGAIALDHEFRSDAGVTFSRDLLPLEAAETFYRVY